MSIQVFFSQEFNRNRNSSESLHKNTQKKSNQRCKLWAFLRFRGNSFLNDLNTVSRCPQLSLVRSFGLLKYFLVPQRKYCQFCINGQSESCSYHPWPCIRLTCLKFLLTNQDLAGEKNFTVLTSMHDNRKVIRIKQLFPLEMALKLDHIVKSEKHETFLSLWF